VKMKEEISSQRLALRKFMIIIGPSPDRLTAGPLSNV
jgi:hypothetical protein